MSGSDVSSPTVPKKAISHSQSFSWGDDAVDGAVENALLQGLHVGAEAQRWVHLEVGVVLVGDVLLVEEEVVGRDLAGHGQALGLGAADEIEPLGGGDVRDVQGAAGETAELDVAIDLELLAERRPAEHAEAGARTAFVDDAARGERLDLAVGDGDAVELGDVLHAGAHHAGALHAVAVVGEGAGPLHDHVADLRERLALLAAREGADRADVHEAGTPAVVDLVADLGAGVGHGVGVGHRGDVGEAAVGRRTAARLDGLLVLEAGVAEVHVHVDETRDEVLAGRVDDLGVRRRLEADADLDDVLVVDEHVTDVVKTHLRVDDVGTPKQKRHCSLLPEAGTSRPCA